MAIILLGSLVYKSAIKFARQNLPNLPCTKASLPVRAYHQEFYDLSKPAYVHILHNDVFRNEAGKIVETREGSRKDVEKIKKTFEDYRCEMNVSDNFSAAKINQKMDEVLKKDFTNFSCIFTIIMSHGKEGDAIYGSLLTGKPDDVYYLEKDVVAKCASNRTLHGKPKIFAVQACRANVSGESQLASNPECNEALFNKIDLLFFQSTYRGTVSYRDPMTGSFFIECFISNLHNYNQQSITTIGPIICKEVSEIIPQQVPTMKSTLRKDMIVRDLLKKPCDT